jgi:glyoxylase-like metal-dependent hydrolase (beta-lactamase superfamily II)
VHLTDDDPDGDWTAPGVHRCSPAVHRIPLPLPNDGLRAVNVYAIADAGGWTLIDSGWALTDARELLEAALGALGAGLADVRRFLVTHLHRDHYTQAIALRRELGVPVALGRGEQPGLAAILDPTVPPTDRHLHQLRRAGAAALVDQLAGVEREGSMPLYQQPDEWLDDGTEITLDPDGTNRQLQAIATPGHTRGHLVFADDRAALLFAGDHVLPRITPSIGFEPVPAASPLTDFLTSLQLIRSRPDAALLPAHGPVGMRVHQRVDELLAHHGHRLDATLAAVRAGRTTPYEVAGALTWTRRERRLTELDPFNTMLATLETGAHLAVLAERGAVRVTERDGVSHYEP